MGKKTKQSNESSLDRERATEADYYARKCGLTKEEALKIIKDAGPVKLPASFRDRSMRR